MAILGRGQPNPPVLSRNSLQDDAVLTIAPPVVVSSPRHPAWLPTSTTPIISRSSLEDAVVVTAATPAPVVVAAPTPPSRFAPGPPIVDRGTLQDDPVLITAPLIVVDAPTVPRPVVPPIIGRSSLEDVAVAPSAVTPEPIVVVPQPVNIWRQLPIITRPLPPDLATPAPLVILPQPRRPTPTWPIVLRSTLFDPPVLTTPQPIVIAAPRWRAMTYPILSVAPFIVPPPDIIDANGRVVVTQTVASAVDGASAPSSEVGVTQTFVSTASGSSAASGAASVTPTSDGRAEVN